MTDEPVVAGTPELLGFRLLGLQGRRHSDVPSGDGFSTIQLDMRSEPDREHRAVLSTEYSAYEGDRDDVEGARLLYSFEVVMEFRMEFELADSEEFALAAFRQAWPHIYSALWGLAGQFRVPLRGLPMRIPDSDLRVAIHEGQDS